MSSDKAGNWTCNECSHKSVVPGSHPYVSDPTGDFCSIECYETWVAALAKGGIYIVGLRPGEEPDVMG